MELNILQSTFSQNGQVVFIGIRSKRLEPVTILSEVLAVEDKGLSGDRYNNTGGARQVTLIQYEHLQAVASLLGKGEIDPTLVRRNIVIKGINLLALKGKQFEIGEATFEYSGECHPCSRMEEALGTGGYNAMRGHGGITAKVVTGGLIKISDIVRPVVGNK